MRAAFAVAAIVALLGCESAAEPAGRLAPAAGEARTRDGEDDSQAEVFGAALDDALPITPLGEIAAAPERFRDRVVRTEGSVARVCQRMGCWMELRDHADGPAVRVPMAGHAFFLPRDAAGRHATMQGRVTLRELPPDERAHLESEGAIATASALSIEASGVLLD